MSQGQEPARSDAPEVAFERRDVKWRPVLILLAVITAILIGLQVLVTAMFGVMAKTTRNSKESTEQESVEAAQQLRALRRSEDDLLSSYGWISRDERIVRIPIDRAMDLIIDEYGEQRP